MYLHAYKLRDALVLTPMEIYETRGVVQDNVVMIGIGMVALRRASLNRPQFSGLWLGSVHGKGRRKLMV